MPDSDKQTHQSVAAMMESFLVKVAEEEKAAGNLDLAGDAKSKHPSAQADDSTRPAAEGARSAENEADVKKTTPNTINDASTANTAGGSKKPSDTQGTQSMSSDESAAGNVDTPKNQHSMASNAATGPGMEGKNDKAAGDDVASVVKLGNDLLAQIALLTKVGGEAAAGSGDGAAAEGAAANAGAAAGEGQAANAGQKADEGADGKQADEEAMKLFKEAAEKYPEDVEAGYVAAAMLAQQLGLLPEEKQASDVDITSFIAGICKQAEEDAVGYVEFLKGYKEAVEKGAQPMDAAGAGAGAGAGVGAGLDPSMLAALGNAEEGEAVPGAAEEGGEAAMGGEGEPSDEEAIEAIAEALDEAGVTPEQLAQAVAAAEGGGEGEEEGEEGGMPPGAEGGMPGAAGGMPPGLETAASRTAPTTKQAAPNAKVLKTALAGYFG